MERLITIRPELGLAGMGDEPLSSLDSKLRGHLRAVFSRLTAELGVTTVYVTHDQSEARSLGRVAVMRGGVLQQPWCAPDPMSGCGRAPGFHCWVDLGQLYVFDHTGRRAVPGVLAR